MTKLTKLTAKALAARAEILNGYEIQNDLSPTAVHAFLAKHAKWDRGTGLWTVHTPMRVFKQTCPNRHRSAVGIVELVIPEGALIHAMGRRNYYMQSYRKMRVSEAKVVRQWDRNSYSWMTRENWTPMDNSVSQHDTSFVYKDGRTVKPSGEPFYTGGGVCEAGIHFFIDLEDALAYEL